MRLGDLDELKEQAKNTLVGESINTVLGINLYKIFEEIIDNAPTVEGEILTKEAYSDLCLRASKERSQGKWIKKQVTPASCTYVCSECGIEEVILSNFCRYCGAEMGGKEE